MALFIHAGIKINETAPSDYVNRRSAAKCKQNVIGILSDAIYSRKVKQNHTE